MVLNEAGGGYPGAPRTVQQLTCNSNLEDTSTHESMSCAWQPCISGIPLISRNSNPAPVSLEEMTWSQKLLFLNPQV